MLNTTLNGYEPEKAIRAALTNDCNSPQPISTNLEYRIRLVYEVWNENENEEWTELKFNAVNWWLGPCALRLPTTRKIVMKWKVFCKKEWEGRYACDMQYAQQQPQRWGWISRYKRKIY